MTPAFERHARVTATLSVPYARCRSIIDPRLWPASIRQMRAVRVCACQRRADGWSGHVEEEVELTGLGIASLTFTSALDVDVRFGPERARVDYRLRPGGSPLLEQDDGFIEARPLEEGPAFWSTYVVVEKTVRFKPSAPRWLLERSRDLPRMLAHWLHAAPAEMGADYFASAP